jgi:PAS domain S-box-containing protein
VEVNASILPDGRWQGFVRDISERKQAEAKLREAQERIDLTLRGADLGAWDWNIQTDEVVFSQRWAEMRGYRLEEIPPHADSWRTSVHPEDWPQLQRLVEDYLEGRVPEYEAEFRVRTRSGEWLWVLDRGKVFARDERGRPLRMVGTELDITARRQVTTELREAIQFRDELLGIVAHDLRNPLSTIVMQASLLRRHGSGPEHRAAGPAEAIQRAAIRMNRLIQDLLDVNMLDAGRFSIARSRLAVGRVISEALEAQRALASGGRELRLDVAPGVPDVLADRHRLLQVFENLLSNALKFTGPGGCVTAGAAPLTGEVLFWVADTGPSIPAEDVPHLFDRFWRGRNARYRGAGLGLPIVKGIVEAHGGRVWFEGAPGWGSIFFFTIPAAPRTGDVEEPARLH